MSKSVLTKTVSHNIVLNIMTDCTSNETTLVDDRDPPWITSKSKSTIQEKNLFYKKYLKPKKHFKHFLKFRNEFG